ncbi:hypothetical protein HY024_02585 [Candidatus Curtissbacteria bacterium]|nr:hypothetical protein [Candidatus Curtissbacteria bacterium]
MRDLARSGPFLGKRITSRKGRMRLLVIFIAAAIASYLIGNYQPSTAKQSGPVVLRDAPNDLTGVSLAGISKAIATGVSLTTGKAVMKDLKYGGSAKAEITRAYGAGLYKLDVNAVLPDPVNVPYAFWLVGDDGVPVLVDYMKGDKTQWTLNVSGPDKFSKLTGVIISLERTKDNKVEEKIMEGSF